LKMKIRYFGQKNIFNFISNPRFVLVLLLLMEKNPRPRV
jgi:hypothetical protein